MLVRSMGRENVYLIGGPPIRRALQGHCLKEAGHNVLSNLTDSREGIERASVVVIIKSNGDEGQGAEAEREMEEELSREATEATIVSFTPGGLNDSARLEKAISSISMSAKS